MLFGELQGMENAQCFVDTSSQGQIIYHHMADDALTVDEKEAAQGDTA